MTRVSENSSSATLKYALNRTKAKMEDLQLKGSTLKTITKPSDNPLSNVEAMSLTSSTSDNVQYLKNADFALLNLNITEKSLEELTDIMSKAKDIAITQSSDFFNADVRKSVSNEVQQLYNQSLGVANKKIGVKNIFAGTNTLTVPFDANGNYKGDTGHINLEVSSSFFVPINLHGEEVFFNSADDESSENSLNSTDEIKTNKNGTLNRDLASKEAKSVKDKNGKDFVVRDNIFSQLQALTSALENNDPEMIQGLLDKFDATISRLISLRTKVGSISSSVESSKVMIENENVDHISRKSSLVDADVAELFSDLNKQQAILKTTYQSTQGIINQSLMDFLRR
jgi:flagellar hook-associated protein 3 FlgL